jgi:hypothetical protein
MHNKSFPKTAVTIREPLCEKKTIFVFLKSLGYYAKQFISQNGGNINIIIPRGFPPLFLSPTTARYPLLFLPAIFSRHQPARAQQATIHGTRACFNGRLHVTESIQFISNIQQYLDWHCTEINLSYRLWNLPMIPCFNMTTRSCHRARLLRWQ